VEILIRKSDGQRVAALYDSSLLIVLNTADGSLVRAQSNAAMRCSTLGCTFIYDSANILLIGNYYNSGISSNYLGLSLFRSGHWNGSVICRFSFIWYL